VFVTDGSTQRKPSGDDNACRRLCLFGTFIGGRGGSFKISPENWESFCIMCFGELLPFLSRMQTIQSHLEARSRCSADPQGCWLSYPVHAMIEQPFKSTSNCCPQSMPALPNHCNSSFELTHLKSCILSKCPLEKARRWKPALRLVYTDHTQQEAAPSLGLLVPLKHVAVVADSFWLL